MFESLRWWLSLRRNRTLHKWMLEQYSWEELGRLVEEATDADLRHTYNVMARDTYVGGGLSVLSMTVRRLYSRYGEQIWSACYRAATNGQVSEGASLYANWLAAFGTLPLASQVIEPPTFEEFLVRNAIRQCAIELHSDRAAGKLPALYLISRPSGRRTGAA